MLQETGHKLYQKKKENGHKTKILIK